MRKEVLVVELVIVRLILDLQQLHQEVTKVTLQFLHPVDRQSLLHTNYYSLHSI